MLETISKSRRMRVSGKGVSAVVAVAAALVSSAATADADIRVAVPDSLVGLPKATEPEVTGRMDAMVAHLRKAVPPNATTVGASYGRTGADRARTLVTVMAVSGPGDPGPIDALINTFDMGDSGPARDIAPVDPGPLGGSAKCGSQSFRGKPVAKCAWSDPRGSIGLVTWTGPDAPAELRRNFTAIRSQIQRMELLPGIPNPFGS